MRDAKAGDFLRRLRTRGSDWKIRLNRFAIEAVPSLGTIEVPIQAPLTVFSGPNGVGKTTLLRAMWAALDAEGAASTIAVNRKLSSGTALVEFLVEGGSQRGEVRFTSDIPTPVESPAIVVSHIDSAALTPIHQVAFCEFPSVEEIINGAGPRALGKEDLEEVNYILHRSYRSVTVYEVDLDDTVPFFEVAYGDDRYDSRTMGAGELAALYIWWAVGRAEPHSVVLIEEPEAFLSFGSQRSLANFLVATIVKKKLVCVMSSHSAAFISFLPRECLVFFSRQRSGISTVDRPPPALLKEMGIDPSIKAIVFVEDALARIFGRMLLERYDPLLSRQVHIEKRKGDGDVVAALRPMLGSRGPIRFLGLFDGDLRGKIPEEVVSVSAFLPGEQPIEVMFRTLVEADPALLERATGNAGCSAIVSSLEGKDHHDWYESLSQEMGLSGDQLFGLLFAIWLGKDDNDARAAKAYEELCELCTQEGA